MASSSSTKPCSKCGQVKLANAEYFGHQPNGTLRHVCRACMNKRSKDFARDNPDNVRRRATNRRQQADKFKPTKALKTQLIVEQEGLCALCCKSIDRDALFDAKEVQVEHLIPVSRGGTNENSNLVIACRICNQEKAGKTMREYWIWREKVGLPKIPHLIDKMMVAIARDE